MEAYIGFDISLQTVHACAVNNEGEIMREGACTSDVAALSEWLGKHGGDWTIKRIVFETGPMSAHFYRGLADAGFPVVCIDARHAHGTLKAQRIKTDRNDARGLAQLARTGWFKAVHIKTDDAYAMRMLIAGRKQIVNNRLNLENHIRGTLKTFGIKLGTVTGKEFSAKAKATIAKQDPLVRGTILALLKARDSLQQQEKLMDKACAVLAKTDAVCKRLMTIPGVGPLTALAFKSEIDDPTRFRRSRDVGVHLGLTPRKYASGEVDYSGGISKCGDPATRSALYEAALCMLTRSKKWSRLKAWGVNLAKRSGFQTACTAVARKLAVIMHRMWLNETEFAYGQPPAALQVA